jgi:hypothetical protein
MLILEQNATSSGARSFVAQYDSILYSIYVLPFCGRFYGTGVGGVSCMWICVGPGRDSRPRRLQRYQIANANLRRGYCIRHDYSVSSPSIAFFCTLISSTTSQELM